MERDIRFNRERMMAAANYYGSKGITPQTAQIRIEVPLETGRGTYEFDIKKAVVIGGTEKAIKNNDLFVCRAIGMALMVEVDTAKGTAPLLSYPMQDGLHLPTGLKGFVNTNPFSLYNGVLTLKTDQNVNFSGFPTSHFLHIPQTQPVGLLNSTDVVVPSGILPEFKMEHVLYELPEMLIFAGNHDNQLKLDAPVASGVTLAGPSGSTSKVVFIAEGWLYAQGAQDKFKDGSNPLKEAI